MAARHCSIHGINFPAHAEFQLCPVCMVAGLDQKQANTDYISNAEPDEDWNENARRRICDIRMEQAAREQIPVVKGAEVKVRNGQLWVSRWDTFKSAGTLKEDDLFQIGEQVFEVIGQDWGRREYLVRPFSMTLPDEDLARFCDGCGGLCPTCGDV